MAIAFLYEIPPPTWAEAGTRWFHVQSWPFDAAPFDGPADRDWDRFAVVDDGHAGFVWRSAADRIRDIARQVASDELEVGAALADCEFGEYMERQVGLRSELSDDEELDEPTVTIDEIISDIADGSTDPASVSTMGYYCADGDLHLRHAAAALAPLPVGARRRFVDCGGPGMGYEAAVIVLEEGYSLYDLALHLGAVAVGR